MPKPPENFRPSLRLWPGVVAATLLWLSRFGVKAVVPGFTGFVIGILASFAFAFVVVIWWAFFSRVPRSDRWGTLGLMAIALAVTLQLNHESMGAFWLLTYGIPVLSVAFVASVAATRRLPDRHRRAAMVATILLASGLWTLVRTEGVAGDMFLVFGWRWSPSPEERLLAHDEKRPPPVALPPAAIPEASTSAALERSTARVPVASEGESGRVEGLAMSEPEFRRVEWAGFRGSRRDGIVSGAQIETDWSKSPPAELWRRPIGPGWSSFAVGGDRIYTQEQRGDDEIVACYNASTGEPIWMHRDATRFFEAMGGAGPRATPTISNGRVYAFGATGIVNALDAYSGAVVWSRNASSDTGAARPTWGFSSSPLVVGDLVIVAVASQLVAYDASTGKPRWVGAPGGEGYSSPQLLTIDGVPQVVLMTAGGVSGVAPADGIPLWQFPTPGSFPIVQPALAADGDFVISAGTSSGGAATSRIRIARGPDGWTAHARWTSNGLKPFFNDFVLHKGHAFGFDGNILASINLEDGKRRWKGGRYGNGQLILLADQDLLLVLSEDGDLALVSATPDQFREIAHVAALNGKTWNHPVLVGDVLLVRNGEEMAAFRLALAIGTAAR